MYPFDNIWRDWADIIAGEKKNPIINLMRLLKAMLLDCTGVVVSGVTFSCLVLGAMSTFFHQLVDIPPL